jgi:hypothetical protein
MYYLVVLLTRSVKQVLKSLVWAFALEHLAGVQS